MSRLSLRGWWAARNRPRQPRLPRRLRWLRSAVEPLEPRWTPSTLIYANPDRRDLVYDTVRNLLYITTSAGAVQRYDPVSGGLLAPLTVPGSASLNGADITPDGSVLLATDGVTGGTGGFV